MAKIELSNVTSASIYRGGDITSKRTWGEPLKIVMAIMDRRCPECNTSTRDELRLDIGRENGRIFGGLCFNCNWRFVIEETPEEIPGDAG